MNANDNRKARAPKVAVTEGMIAAGKEALDSLTQNEDATDDQLVAEIFFQMWSVYWLEIAKVTNQKIARFPVAKPGLILPPGRA
jgi:hypothetical protein